MKPTDRASVNKAIARLKRRILYWRRTYGIEHERFLRSNDMLGNALFREIHHLKDKMRLKGLMWKDGKVFDNGIR